MNETLMVGAGPEATGAPVAVLQLPHGTTVLRQGHAIIIFPRNLIPEMIAVLERFK